MTHVGNGRGVRIHLVLNKWRPAASWSMRVGGGNVDVASASAQEECNNGCVLSPLVGK